MKNGPARVGPVVAYGIQLEMKNGPVRVGPVVAYGIQSEMKNGPARAGPVVAYGIQSSRLKNGPVRVGPVVAYGIQLEMKNGPAIAGPVLLPIHCNGSKLSLVRDHQHARNEQWWIQDFWKGGYKWRCISQTPYLIATLKQLQEKASTSCTKIGLEVDCSLYSKAKKKCRKPCSPPGSVTDESWST